MRVWLACFLVLFALAELFDWLQDFRFPLPIYILGGAFLAVASNYDKFFGYYISNVTDEASELPTLDSSPSVPITTNSLSDKNPQLRTQNLE